MGLKLLQINFPFNGPWGNEMAQAYSELAHKLSETPGLLWKIWIENPSNGETGGIYLFEDASSLDTFLTEHITRLKSFGIENISAKQFDVNEQLTQITGEKLNWGTFSS
ncbi:MAG: monooxygenase [Mastigocladus sp. ERB_26_2]